MARKSKTNFRDRQKDYIEVAERVVEFIEANPEGSLQSEIVTLDITGYDSNGNAEGVVVMKGLAYRNPDDPRPGVGFSMMAMPGRTPYTKGSEIENAETSAWGRAIVALGISAKRGIASANEVRNKSAEDEDETQETKSKAKASTNGKGSDKDRDKVLRVLKQRIREANELGSKIVNRHSIRNHVAKTEETGEFETLADLYKNGTYDQLVHTGRYVAAKIEEATETEKEDA